MYKYKGLTIEKTNNPVYPWYCETSASASEETKTLKAMRARLDTIIKQRKINKTIKGYDMDYKINEIKAVLYATGPDGIPLPAHEKIAKMQLLIEKDK